ncbi:MAG: SDR family NAD(P)-dependent oxidoreductase, partial [Burkholderiales bacterium]
MFELKSKTAVVTGGAHGIGAATARLFERSGAKVEVLDIVSGCDVTDEEQVRKALARIGAIDILVNNAGRAVRKDAVQISREEWHSVLDLN